MKINRLFEIVYLLQEKKCITAKVLAEYFEVSVRTIYRDIETLSEAGFPIYMQQGKGGGITLMDHFVLDKSVLLKPERQELLNALQVLKITPQNEDLLRRMSMFLGEAQRSWLSVDFSDWGRNPKEEFLKIKEAILQREILAMHYYNGQGEKSQRQIAPLQLCFKHRSWYLKAYCYKREGLRLFKLGRIKDLTSTGRHFEEDLEEYLNEPSFNGVTQTDTEQMILQIEGRLAYRVYEEFEEYQIEKLEDGSFKVHINYPEDEWLYNYLLSFGPYLEVIAPQRVRKILKSSLEKMLLCYTKYDS